LRPDPHLPAVESDLSLPGIVDSLSYGNSIRLKKAQVSLKTEGQEAEILALAPGRAVFLLRYVYSDFSDRPLGCGSILIPTTSITLESKVGLWN